MAIRLIGEIKGEVKEEEEVEPEPIKKEKKPKLTLKEARNQGLILPNEAGTKFYYKALSPKAKKAKRTRRQLAKKGRRGNR